jgi:hypothetical protein
MLFSRKNPPTGFYVYLYLREDGTPYYVGKGKNLRAWAKHNVNLPKDEQRIQFVATKLLEHEACVLEIRLIQTYGRKNNNTGILRNMTDGGEGISGFTHSEESKEKNRISNSGSNHPHYGIRGENHFNHGRKNPEHSERMKGSGNSIHKPGAKENQKKNTPRGDRHYTKTDEGRKKVSGENNPRYDSTIHTFKHSDGTVEVCSRYQLNLKYPHLHRGGIRMIVSGERKTHQGWMLVK